jgi:hypothetical protein
LLFLATPMLRTAAERRVRRLRMTRSPKEKSCPRTRPAVEATAGVRQVLDQGDRVAHPEDLAVTGVPLVAMALAVAQPQVLHELVLLGLVLRGRATPVGGKAARDGIGPPETSTAVRTVEAPGWRPRSRGFLSLVSRRV